MAKDPEYSRTVSLHLARTLDEIGLNTLVVDKRREDRLFREQMRSLLFRITGSGSDWVTYHFGSQTEGATTPGMNSDLDTLLCFSSVNVIEKWVDWKQGEMNLLMLQEEGTAQGYCRLQLLRSDVPMAAEYLPDEDYIFDGSGRVILKNKMMHSVLGEWFQDRNGPAASRCPGPGFMDIDYVCALRCRTWPKQAAEFTRRRRRYGWPSECLLKEAVSHGVFLVPVGYKLSPTEPLEWRISASLAERCFMFSLDIVHIKCYVVLKILVKTFIDSRVRKCISSYHCKTALLHCTESTEYFFWQESNLLQCVTRCLEILRNWVSNLFCPQFTMNKVNLFAGKVDIDNRELLLSILTELIQGIDHVLLKVGMDDLGNRLQTKLNTVPSSVPVLDSLTSVMLVGTLNYGQKEHITNWLINYILSEEVEHKEHGFSFIRSVYQKTSNLNEKLIRAIKHERQALETVIPRLFCWLGSLLASFSLSHNRRVPRQAIQLMSISTKVDVASMLKLASVFYCSEKLRTVEALLQATESHFQRNDLLVVCGCYEKPTVVPQAACHMIYVLRGMKRCARLFAHCVTFSRNEIYCVPPALNSEMHRSIGDDTHHRRLLIDDWMILAAVDCLPYLYYLQYLTYRQLEKHDLQRLALFNLNRCIRETYDLRHPETAWNLLGQCLEIERQPETAMVCYRVSLRIRPRNNAAKWHVAILWYKMIKGLGLLPSVTEVQTEK